MSKKREPLISSDRESFETSDDQSIGCCNTEQVRELESYMIKLEKDLESAKNQIEKTAEDYIKLEKKLSSIAEDFRHLRVLVHKGSSIDRIAKEALILINGDNSL
jgi:septal ring factor EnvC (AmiA/AmiB activator)